MTRDPFEVPDVPSFRVAAADLNGVARGKQMGIAQARQTVEDGTRFPYSALNLDIRGEDIEGSPLVFDSGDADAHLKPTDRGWVPAPWLKRPAALLPIWTFHEDGRPFAGDPRQALKSVCDRLAERGLRPVIGTELEFYLADDSGADLRPPFAPRTGNVSPGGEVLSLRELDDFEDFFADLYAGAAAMDIPAETATSESGQGQFEMNLGHQADALRAADDAWLFKLLVKGLARRHGFAGTFMAKPFEDQPGTGMHIHVSLLDASGQNVLDDGTGRGSALLHQAVAGLLKTLAPATLVFAPHSTSYDRLVPGAHAPTAICWAYENRTSAVRIPGGSPKARRIEHRVAGGDVNPYLLFAAVLGGMLLGLEDGMDPPAPISGNAYDQPLPQVPSNWDQAIDLFGNDPLIARVFSPDLIRYFCLTKRQEAGFVRSMSPDERLALYLETV